ncbi:MAG: DUF3828 domain-containing protein [Acidobacteria bacterium ACB1]|nr:DUF3828 domain-containing protein [Acidobacteria bacterium ACB1]
MKPIITACLSVLFLVFCGCTVAKSTNTNVSAAESTNAEPAATPMSGAGKVNLPAPETVVQALYKAHDAKKSPFFQSKDRALVDKYFSKPLADLIWKDATTHTSDVGVIDGDPLYNAQDVEIKDLKIGTGQIDAKNEKKATVNVTFTNFGKPNTIKFEMSAGAESWKIDDIVYSPSDSMLKWFKEADKPADTPAVAGEFEGKYRVGETTCTVKPVKKRAKVLKCSSQRTARPLNLLRQRAIRINSSSTMRVTIRVRSIVRTARRFPSQGQTRIRLGSLPLDGAWRL